MHFFKRFLLIIHKQFGKKEKLIILHILLKKKKRRKKKGFDSRKYHEFRGLKTHSLEKPKTIYILITAIANCLYSCDNREDSEFCCFF